MNSSGHLAILMLESDLRFPITVRNGQLPMEFWECGIADRALKVIFYNTYLWVILGRSFIFHIILLIYLFPISKVILQKLQVHNYIGSWIDSLSTIINSYT